MLKNIVLTYFKGTPKGPLLYFWAFLIVFSGFLIFRQNLSSPVIREDPKDYSFQNLFLSQTKAALSASPQLLLIQSTGLLSASPPEVVTPQSLGAIFLTTEPKTDRRVLVEEYIVEPGDTLSLLAAEFNISAETLLWANNLSKNSLLKTGQKLVVPAVSGVIHYVKDKDTISSIAATYKASAEEIIAFNELAEQGQIYIGDIIVVPGGIPPSPARPSVEPATTAVADSYFICPTAGCRINQGLHWYNAIDFDGDCGDPIRASAGGQVLKVALTTSTSRYAFGGAGNHITILHPNGVVTSYGHISASLVSPGEEVSQGQTIGLVGGQPGTPGAGISTGCHVHFGVTGARNPFAK